MGRFSFLQTKTSFSHKLAAPVFSALEKNEEDTDGFKHILFEFCHLIIQVFYNYPFSN